MPLEDYHAKRQFDRTSEPRGQAPEPAHQTAAGAPAGPAPQAAGAGEGPLRFVVQKHAATALHYDFRLEMGGVLKSWAVPKGPSLNPADKHLAMATEDHPLDYRAFEGVIPKGNYGAGSVIVWDEGTYKPLGASGYRDADDRAGRHAVHAGHLTFILHGHKLNGEFALVKMPRADEPNAWLLIKARKDKWASADADVTQQDRSVITSRTVEAVGEGKPITQIHLNELNAVPKSPLPAEPQPMLATLAEPPFDDPDYLYEIKWDGYRILAEIEPESVTLHSRRSQNYTSRFQLVADELHAGLRLPALIDGEICVVDTDGRPSFQDLQNYLRTGQGRLIYYAFDLLHLNGRDLTSLPLAQRKQILRRLLPQGPHLKYSDHVTGLGTALLAQAQRQGLEGVIAKRAASRYQPGRRSRDWLKFKTHHRQEAVIAGYTQPRAGRQHFGALVLGLYDDRRRLVYAGHTGSGFTDADLRDLYDRLQPLRAPQSPIQPEPQTNEPAQWVRPTLVCEVEFTEWTGDGSMRHPIFVGLREDKPARHVRREQPVTISQEAAMPKPNSNPQPSAAQPDDLTIHTAGHSVGLTHRRKLYFPDDHLTKGDLLNYYQTIAPTILPYLRDRPESLNRFPGGITGSSFYQKDVEDHPSWVKTTRLHSDSTDKDINYVLCQDEATLLYLINLGCIELNPWNSRLGHLDNPDWCVLDLDPEGVDFDAVIRTAQAVKTVLDRAELAGYPKTSGATGLHIYLPMAARYTYDQVKDFARILVQLVHAELPELTSLERNPAKRPHRVYLDYLQNRHGQTLAAPYAVRPRPGAPVSTPLQWNEVAPGLTPTRFTLRNLHDRLADVGDLWQPVLGPGINLRAALNRLES